MRSPPGGEAGLPREPTFTVIVPAFNSQGRIEGVLRSVLAQTRSDLEVIVIDDGSTDGTAERVEVLARADRRVRLQSQPNGGTVSARNTGLGLARGRFLSFLDDDDEWLPGYLEAVGSAFDRTPDAGLAFSDAFVRRDPEGVVEVLSALDRFARPIRLQPFEVSGETALRALLRVNFITTCAATFTRSALTTVGPLNPAIRGSDDWDLWVRIAGADFGLVRVPGRLAIRRIRPDSVGADELMMARGSLAVLDGFLASGQGGSRARRTARRHRALIALEIRALESGSKPSRALFGAMRRIGRKRLRLT